MVPTTDQATLHKHRPHWTHLQSPPHLPLAIHVISSLQLETNSVCHVSKELNTKVHAVLLAMERFS